MSVLKGNKNFYQYEISDQVAQNIKEWLSFGLIEMGAFTVVTRSSAATSGYSTLQRVYDDRYGANKVFEGLGEWVWESGIAPIGGGDTTFKPSGVYVGNIFYPTSASGSYSHTIDYKNGRVIFDSSVSPSVDVQCEYVARDVAIYLSDSPQWKRMTDIYTERFFGLEDASPLGVAQVLKENRIWLPCVIIETEDVTNNALQLGGGEIATCAIRYHIFSDKAFSSKRLSDTLVNQDEKRLNLYNINTAPFAIKWNGTLSSGALTYPELSDRNSPYFWTYADLENSTGGPADNLADVYRAEVRQTIDVARYNSTY